MGIIERINLAAALVQNERCSPTIINLTEKDFKELEDFNKSTVANFVNTYPPEYRGVPIVKDMPTSFVVGHDLSGFSFFEGLLLKRKIHTLRSVRQPI